MKRVGIGFSVPMADMDFETYSEAGFEWNEQAQKWQLPTGSGASPTAKKGLPLVGVAAYATHPSTEVLCLSYNLKNGDGPKQWRPGMAPPIDLLDHVVRGGRIEAHNSMFEWWIWNFVCTRLYGWPALPQAQMRCSAAKCRAYGLPASLANAGAVLGIEHAKDPLGKKLIQLFSIPRNPTKTKPAKRLLPADDAKMGPKLYEYCDRDIVAESEISDRVPDLVGTEWRYWQLDQVINQRGVHVDMPMVNHAIAIIEQITEAYNEELQELTGGIRASEVAQLKTWIEDKGGIVLAGLDKDEVADALVRLAEYAQEGMVAEEDARLAYRALEIRQALGASSIKKVYAMRNQVGPNSRLYCLFNYHGARTGRPTGEGPQPTNLPKAGPKVALCGCGRYYGASMKACPWCGVPVPPGRRAVDWGAEVVEQVMEVMEQRDYTLLERYYGQALKAVSGCLRGMLTAAPGHELVCSDFNAIEGVVTAQLAGEEWRLDVFRTHGKIYEMSASKITGVPFEEMMEYKRQTGNHHPDRNKIGKYAELACLTAETLVLTDAGYKAIVDVTLTDKLWDGMEWVNHRGVILKGIREVLDLDGIGMTPNHLVICKGSWKEARQLVSNEGMKLQALASGSENLPLSVRGCLKERAPEQWFGAHAEGLITKWTLAAFVGVNPPVATSALSVSRYQPGLRSILNTPISYLMWNTVGGFLTDLLRPLEGVILKMTSAISITELGGLKSAMNGVQTEGPSCYTRSLWKDGTTLDWRWIESTSTRGTNLAILGSYLNRKTHLTREVSSQCNSKSTASKNVYDIVLAGPRNRFTVKSNSGHLIVHNCGFGGWVSAMQAFGAGEYLSEPEMKTAVLEWREASPAIVELWGGQWRGLPWQNDCHAELYGLEGAWVRAMLQENTWQSYRDIAYMYHANVMHCHLPSGRIMHYQNPKMTRGHYMDAKHGREQWNLSYETWNTSADKGAQGWATMNTYGGRLTENVVQAAARDIQVNAQLNLEDAGYRIVLHVYDENVAEVPVGFGSVEEFEKIMKTMPDWAKDWPINASGGWRGVRYRKD